MTDEKPDSSVLERPFEPHERCESCGHPADVQLVDTSFWCFRCDASARAQGYDDTPIAAVREFWFDA